MSCPFLPPSPLLSPSLPHPSSVLRNRVTHGDIGIGTGQAPAPILPGGTRHTQHAQTRAQPRQGHTHPHPQCVTPSGTQPSRPSLLLAATTTQTPRHTSPASSTQAGRSRQTPYIKVPGGKRARSSACGTGGPEDRQTPAPREGLCGGPRGRRATSQLRSAPAGPPGDLASETQEPRCRGPAAQPTLSPTLHRPGHQGRCEVLTAASSMNCSQANGRLCPPPAQLAREGPAGVERASPMAGGNHSVEPSTPQGSPGSPPPRSPAFSFPPFSGGHPSHEPRVRIDQRGGEVMGGGQEGPHYSHPGAGGKGGGEEGRG